MRQSRSNVVGVSEEFTAGALGALSEAGVWYLGCLSRGEDSLPDSAFR